MAIVDKFRPWLEQRGQELMVLLSYDTPTVKTFIEKGERFDQELVRHLESNNFVYVDLLKKAAEEFKAFNLSVDEFLGHYYIASAGAQVFGHYNSAGNFWFAHAIREELVDWLDPKPPTYQ